MIVVKQDSNNSERGDDNNVNGGDLYMSYLAGKSNPRDDNSRFKVCGCR